VALSLRQISGTGGFAVPGVDLAASYQKRYRNQNRLFVEYGNPGSYRTLQRFIVRYVIHVWVPAVWELNLEGPSVVVPRLSRVFRERRRSVAGRRISRAIRSNEPDPTRGRLSDSFTYALRSSQGGTVTSRLPDGSALNIAVCLVPENGCILKR